MNGDILQGGFKDTPFESTRKFEMALTWVNQNMNNCRPKFILKTQENIFHNMHAIIPWLMDRYAGEKGVYIGKILRKDRPIRDHDDPMRVDVSDYNGEFYPDMIQGPVYMFSQDVFTNLYNYMTSVTPIAPEDAYIGLLAAKGRAYPKHNDHFLLLKRPSNMCHHLKMFFVYDIMPIEHIEIFKGLGRARDSNECLGAVVIDHMHGRGDRMERIEI